MVVTQKWKTVRPWLPPASSSASTASTTPDGPSSPTQNRSRSRAASEVTRPRETASPSRHRLQVLDVTSTSVSFSLLETTDGVPEQEENKHKISIKVDGQPWLSVAHADASDDKRETTVIVYGLEPGSDHDIGVDVIKAGESDNDSLLPDEGEEGDEAHAGDEATPSSLPSPEDAPPPPYTPPSPATPAPPEEPTEVCLREALRALRASTKRTETVLVSSTTSLRKALDKGLREDQRARTRIGGLEESIRRAATAELEAVEGLEDVVRDREEREKEEAYERDRLREWKEGVARGDTRSLVEREKMEKERKERERLERERADDGDEEWEADAEGEQEAPGEGEDCEHGKEGHEGKTSIAKLSRELERLTMQMAEVDRARTQQAADALRALDSELGQIEGELMQLDREEAHAARYAMQSYYAHGTTSTDSLDRYHHSGAPHPHSLSHQSSSHNLALVYSNPSHASSNVVLPTVTQPPSIGSRFNLNWKRSPAVPVAPPMSGSAAPGPGFGRFFRRNVSDPSNPPSVVPLGVPSHSSTATPPDFSQSSISHGHSLSNPSSLYGGAVEGLQPGTAAYRAQQRAMEYQNQWGLGLNQTSSGSVAPNTTSPPSGWAMAPYGGRRRSGSLNSIASSGSSMRGVVPAFAPASGGSGGSEKSSSLTWNPMGGLGGSGRWPRLKGSALGYKKEVSVVAEKSEADSAEEKEAEKSSNTGGRWSWSQVVGKGRDKTSKEDVGAIAEAE